MVREIILTQGKVALVDDVDYDGLSKSSWCFSHGYAYRKDHHKTVYMHRQILGYPKARVDHKDRNKLNNIRSNLRILSRSGLNQANAERRSDNRSGYKGVCFDKRRSKWNAEIQANKKRKSLGAFTSAEEAAKAYDKAAKKLFGEFACLNFKELL